MNWELLQSFLPESLEEVTDNISDLTQFQISKDGFLTTFLGDLPAPREDEVSSKRVKPAKSLQEPPAKKKRTIPQPFNLSVSTGTTIRTRRVQEMISDKESEDLRELANKFKANPIPSEIYGDFEERELNRRGREERKLRFELEETAGKGQDKLQALERPVEKIFLPVPPELHRRRTETTPAPEKFRAKSVPNFTQLHKAFQKQLYLKKQSKPTTRLAPFTLHSCVSHEKPQFYDIPGTLTSLDLNEKFKTIIRQNLEKLNQDALVRAEVTRLAEEKSRKKFYVRTKKHAK